MEAPIPEFINLLLKPEQYCHPTERFQVIQTHLSWVILTGPFIYKLKKPVSFGFQDFTTLDKRHYYCDLELILNQRYTQGLYERVVPITGTPEAPVLDGDGEPFEYAVQMKQFQQSDLLSDVVSRDALSAQMIQSLAIQTAQFHQETMVCDERVAFGDPDVANGPVMDNFSVTKQHLTNQKDIESLDVISAHARTSFRRLQQVMAARKSGGYVRACHGDMHLANAVLLPDGSATFFDCIEFNEGFRHTDVMSDIAFLIMDLQAHSRPDLASLFLNTYMEHTGDYGGIAVLNHYCSYRAMVRAKIAVLASSQQTGDEREVSLVRFRRYRDLAATYFQPKPISLEIMFGISGSGKSYFSAGQMQKTGAIRLRSDVERKRLAKLPLFSLSPEAERHVLYSEAMTEKTFAHLAKLTQFLMQYGWPVLVDAAFLRRRERGHFHEIASGFECPFRIWHCQVPDAALKARLAARTSGPSDADISVALSQQEIIEPLDEQEASFAQLVD